MSIFSAGASLYGANKGAKAMADAIEQAVELQREQMRLAKERFTPYADAGTDALGQYQANIGNQPTYENTLANLVNDPGYQFRLQQGQEALENSAAARGNLLSGATLKDLQDYSQGLASQEAASAYARDFDAFNNTQNQLGNLLSLGFDANAQIVGSGQRGTNNLANLALMGGKNTMNLWNSRANALVDLGNNIGQAIGGSFGG